MQFGNLQEQALCSEPDSGSDTCPLCILRVPVQRPATFLRDTA